MEGKEEKNVYTIEKFKKENPPFCHIDKKMIRFKLHFFLFEGALGCVLPYIPVIARDRLGFSATSLAAVLTAQQFLTIVSKPVIGYIVDYFNKLKLVIILIMIIQTIFFFLLLVAPPINPPPIRNPEPNLPSENWITGLIIRKSKLNQECEDYSCIDVFSSVCNSKVSGNESKTIVCVGYENKTSFQCFQTAIDEETFEGERDVCCSMFASNMYINPNISQIRKGKQFFELSLMEPKLSIININSTFRCSVSFAKNELPHSQFFDDFQTLEFWIFALIYSISNICISSLFTLSDTACCESIQKFDGDFGRQRLYGAIGWGVLATIGGLLCDVTNDYIAAWILMAVLQAAALWNISKLNLVKPHFSQSILKDIGTVLKSAEFLTFELGVFMNGIGAGITWFYLVWFLTSLGGSRFLYGLVQYVECFVGEIPFMFFSSWLIQRLGHYHILSLALLCYGVRFLWYSYLQDPWLVLPIEILHGFTYGTFYPAVATYGKMSAKPGTEATTQSILFSTHEGLGAGLGCVLAGVGFDHLGGHQTFFYISIFAFCAALINIFNTFMNRRRTKVLNLTPSTNSCLLCL